MFPFILSKTFQFLFLVSLLSIINSKSYAQPLYQSCGDTQGNYTDNSTYQTNLNLLFRSLSSNASLTGINNVTTGNSPDRIYGLVLCRGDVLLAACKSCVETAAEDIIQLCPYRKVAYIWYDNCFLRYSNTIFFSRMETSPQIYMWNAQNISNPDQFNQLLGGMLNNISTDAALRSSDLFAVGEANFTSFQTLYGLTQCTEDISRSDCRICLQSAISQIPGSQLNGKQGGRILRPSCNFRYETYSFYNATAIAPPPPSPPSPARPPPSPTPPSVTPTGEGSGGSNAPIIAAIVVSTVIAVMLIAFILICFLRRKKKKTRPTIRNHPAIVSEEISSMESLQFDFDTIAAATDNFSEDNKLGEGGFGPVYKGRLSIGQEIAVKRLSRNSGQGAEEFKNEVLLVAKLQHRNLARLLGCCLEGEEKILVYEYIPNKSLDNFLFDPDKRATLDWNIRYKIIAGIARGLLYLHEDSRLRIIHRDLKASNILLDGEMNPKISDFGMARLFVVDQTQGNTNRIAGTYGYMSPEYAMHGQFSVKSDVFSFGILLLEILAGQKNSSFYQSDQGRDLPSYAWRKWREGTALELIDPTLREHCSQSEAMRCIHIALLCVQEDVAASPPMSTIVLMLNSYSVSLPAPLSPGYFVMSRIASDPLIGVSSSQASEMDKSTSKSTPYSINEVSITELYPR
eukprot:TRINITY_DN1315_c1_g1_i1.p1 TRINITY_DN1315_c1_g1~~TRINITY_DN1315_c1_g1_i1.p1  ORF type:complete len:684 (+),score=80.56 TRINITY_DN1315_c1_g1_i1:120-2171(+)